MLRSTFCHIPGIGRRTEAGLWEAGVRTWDDLQEIGEAVLSADRARRAVEHIYRSEQALEEGDIAFFAEALEPAEHWRLFADFRGRAACLDIETTGLSADFGDGITTIALYDGEELHTYVQGENLRDFKDDVRRFDLLITYNGKSFDVPFIERYFMMRLPQAHIDLRYVLRSLGYSGGQKGCERELGIDRGDLDGVDGYFAVLLWHEYQTMGNERALETLLAYNVEDTMNLHRLMLMAHNLKIAETPFEHTARLRVPTEGPHNPFMPDLETIAMIRARMGYGGGKYEV